MQYLTQPTQQLGQAQSGHKLFQLEYAVAIEIAAPAEAVWQILTRAQDYPRWNSTVVSLSGDIVLGGKLILVSQIAPKQPFKLNITALQAPQRMVWQSGQRFFFGGERTYSLQATPEGVIFTMREVFQGLMLPLIAKALPDFRANFNQFAADLKVAAESRPV
jgi:hypothetical protein